MGERKSKDIFICPNCKKIIGSDNKNTSEVNPLRTEFSCKDCDYSGFPSRIANPTYWQLTIISILLITMSIYFPIPIIDGIGTGILGIVLFIYTLLRVPKYKKS